MCWALPLVLGSTPCVGALLAWYYKVPSSHPLELAGSMRELSGDTRRQVITSGTTVTSREREVTDVGSVIKKRRKRMAKKKHRKLLKRTRIQRRRAGK